MSIPSLRIAALAAAGALALALSACTPEAEPSPEPTPTTSAAPIFASDEEALAAAVAAYEAYLAVVDELTQAGGENPERIRAFAETAYAAELEESLAQLRSSGNRTSGDSSADGMELIQYDETSGGAAVSVYACLDVSEVRVLDADGVDVTPIDRIERRPLQLEFVSALDDPERLLPAGTEPWPGDDFC
ncbi:hypothetical protein [Agromyces sp. NPDC058064]|uniref:hypothetical protein n=1 Tax=Agromyces sp. NPDC058064 TaxID=3346322 RepID=UPI0036DC8AA6